MARIWYKKGLVVGIFTVLIGAGVVSGFNIQIKDSKKSIRGNILYVGGIGPGNYSKIQDAIDNTSKGDTVFVYDDSSPYLENIFVTKSILLFGEDKNTTIIEGYEDVLVLQADNITISGFTIQCVSGPHGNVIDIRGIGGIIITQNIMSYYTCGIYCENSHDISIIGNIFQDVYARHGIWLINCNTAKISDNIIKGYNQVGVQSEYCRDLNIFNNDIRKTWCGIYDLDYSKDIKIYNNYLFNNEHGMILYMKNLQLYNNIIQNSKKWGLSCGGGELLIYSNELIDNKIDIFKSNTKVYENNFINDTVTFDYYFGNPLLIYLLKFEKFRNFILNIWFKFHRIPIDVDRNYWENHSSDLPKRIEGDLIWFTGYPPFEEEHSVRWYIYDNNPASEPYDIGV